MWVNVICYPESYRNEQMKKTGNWFLSWENSFLLQLHLCPLGGPISSHKASFLLPIITHKVEQNILAAKYRLTLCFLFLLMCVCLVGVYSTFLESLLLISCLASCSSTSFFSACREPTDSFHTYSACNKLMLLFINARCDSPYWRMSMYPCDWT